jgi:hypothetical protein
MLKLKLVKAVESDTNPHQQHGFLSQCTCGHVLMRDEWSKHSSVLIVTEDGYNTFTVLVNSWFIGLNHKFGDGPDQFYETIVEVPALEYEKTFRYATQADAETHHAEILEKIQNGEFRLIPRIRYEFNLTEDE